MTRTTIALVVCMAAGGALAQTTNKARASSAAQNARADLDELKKRVDELSGILAGMPALYSQLRDVESLLLRVQGQMDRLDDTGLPGRDDDARRELDRLRDRIDDLRERTARLEFEAKLRREAGLGTAPEGPVVHSADGAFALRLGGRLKLRTEYREPDAGDGEVGFQLRQAKVGVGGHLFVPRLLYRVQAEFGRGQATLQDYFVDYARFAPWITIRLGQFKVPFTRQRPTTSAGLQFVDRSLATQEFELSRDLGIQVLGGFLDDRVQYFIAALNGNGPNQARNDNRGLLWVGRFVVSPWGSVPMTEGDLVHQRSPKVSVGGSVAYTRYPTDIVVRSNGNDDRDGDGRVDQVAMTTAGVEVAGHWRGVSVQGEYFVRREDAGSVPLFDTGGSKEYDGAYVQVGYFIVPAHFEGAFRAAFAEPHRYGAPQLERAELPGQIRELAVVLSYLRFGHHLKLQGEYSHIKSEDVPTGLAERTDHRATLQLQVDF